MPRSGTSLTEQIFTAHSQVFGAGELDLLPVLGRLMPRAIKSKRPFPGIMLEMTPKLREEAARYYLYGLKQYDEERPYVVGKMSHNFMNLGLIASILPRAKIIHVRRDARDVGLSNYQQNFKARHGGMGYAFDLEHIARQLNDYHRMMQHWRKVLPARIFEFDYEELVENQQAVTAELFAFVGIEMEEDAQPFYEVERAVRTASVSQARRPMYTSSRQKWRRYEAHLAPLIDNLNPELLQD